MNPNLSRKPAGEKGQLSNTRPRELMHVTNGFRTVHKSTETLRTGSTNLPHATVIKKTRQNGWRNCLAARAFIFAAKRTTRSLCNYILEDDTFCCANWDFLWNFPASRGNERPNPTFWQFHSGKKIVPSNVLPASFQDERGTVWLSNRSHCHVGTPHQSFPRAKSARSTT